MYAKYLGRKPLAVREAARLLTLVPRGTALPGGRRTMGVIKPSPLAQEEGQAGGAAKSG